MTRIGPVVAVGAIVIHDGALLMVKRGKEPARGLWTIPGGHVEHGEFLADAARRELKEETGIDADIGELAGIFEVPGETHYVILDFLATASGDTNAVPAGDAQEARWVPLERVRDYESTPRFVELLTAWGILPSAREESD